MKNICTIWCLLLVWLFLSYQSAVAQVVVQRGVLGSGGTVVADSTLQVFGTIGQPLVGTASNASKVIANGFWTTLPRIVTDVNQNHTDVLPKEYRLEQNYPNPFNPATTIEFAVPKQSSVTLRIFDILGREVAILVDKEFDAGNYQVAFNASELSSGIYFYRINADGFTKTRKLMLMK